MRIATIAFGESRVTMSRRGHFRGALMALVLLLASTATGLAQTQTPPPATQTPKYEPQVGQEGKDVVWVPTSDTLVQKMLDMAKVTPQDFLIDLGSGDGRTVIAAAKRGLTAHGIEYNPDMVALSKVRAAAAGVADRATFEKADIFESDFSRASVITMFLLPSINETLRPTILGLKPGTRIVSNSFDMGAWQPDARENVTEGCATYCTSLLWIVPAKVDGVWRLGDQDLKLTQEFQMLSGTLGSSAISNARMNGSEIAFTAGGVRYAGRVAGTAMSGMRDGKAAWSATRK